MVDRRPSIFHTTKGWLRRYATELRLRLQPPMPWTAILGPDGSGKSSVLDALERRFQEASLQTVRGYWRPGVLLPWEDSGPNTNPYGEEPRGSVISVVKVLFLVTDWLLGYWKQEGYAHHRARNHLVLFDRHYLDLLADPKRYRFKRPMWLARWAAHVVPTPDLLIFLDAPAEVLQQRKQEVSFEETVRQREAYRALAEHLPEARLVDATQPLKDVINEVERILAINANIRVAYSLNVEAHGDD